MLLFVILWFAFIVLVFNTSPLEYIEGMDNEFAKEVRNVEDEDEGKKRVHDDDFTLRPKLSDSLDSIVSIPGIFTFIVQYLSIFF